MSSKDISNVTDLPLPPLQGDLLGQSSYTEALSRFITRAQTPMTIAVQGEWGCGKTSLMNALAGHVCINYAQFCRESEESVDMDVQSKKRSYLGVWINTWQYSILRDDSEAQVSIIRGVARELSVQMNKLSGSASSVKEAGRKLMSSIGGLALTAAKIGVSAAGLDPESLSGLDEVVRTRENGPDYFREKLRESVEMYLSEYNSAHPKEQAKGIIFFIDDLDRLDPPVAVQVLSLLKNLFEVPKCIFVLAIDYEVVVQGLASRFGERTESNEREFRSFFDKIIQLSFRVPIDNYRIEDFLKQMLDDIQYCSTRDLNKPEFMKSLVSLTIATCGKNPRSIKRMVNTLSLIREIHRINTTPLETQNKLCFLQLLYALVCIQSSYPRLYDELVRRPNLFDWIENEGDDDEEITVSDLLREVNEELASSDILLNDGLLSDLWIRKRQRQVQNLLLTVLRLVVNTKVEKESKSANASKFRTTKDVLDQLIQTSRIATNEMVEDDAEEFISFDEFMEYWTTQAIDVNILREAREFCERFNQVFSGAISLEYSGDRIFLRATKNNGRNRVLAHVKISSEGVIVRAGNYRLGITKNGFHKARPTRTVSACSEIVESDIEQIKSIFRNYLDIQRVPNRWINTEGDLYAKSQIDYSDADSTMNSEEGLSASY